MHVRRCAGGLAAAVIAASAAGVLAMSAPVGAATSTTVKLDATGMTASGGGLTCNIPLNGQIALQSGTQITFSNGLVSGLLSPTETLTLTPLNASGQKGTPIVTNQKLDWTPTTALADGTYLLEWSASLAGLLPTGAQGTLVVSPAATTDCKLAVAVPTPAVSVPVLAPILSPVNSLVGGVVGGVNSAVAPVNSAVNKVTSALPAIPGVTAPTATAAAVPNVATPKSGFAYVPWGTNPADLVVPHGYGNGAGSAFTYVPPAEGPGLALDNVAQSLASATSTTGGFHPAPTTTASKSVDLAASKNRGILDSLSGVFVVFAFASLSGAIAYYVRNILMGDGGRFI